MFTLYIYMYICIYIYPQINTKNLVDAYIFTFMDKDIKVGSYGESEGEDRE